MSRQPSTSGGAASTPQTRTGLRVTGEVLEQARTFFETCGARGCEGTALIAGTPVPGCPDVVADTLVIPDQVPTPTLHASVTITAAGDMQVATALAADQHYLARIHSHPGLAFHSPTDDRNPALTHEGAFSIVVPYFGLGLREGLDACAVFVRENGAWTELAPGTAERDRLVSTDA